MIRKIKQISKSRPVIEGAGVRLKRAFGFGDTVLTDPFLLLDDFRGNNPEDYIAGFPWHPHRGIETITYMINGCVKHKDSLGNSGIIEKGCVQWMTAGSGIIHQEMPEGKNGDPKMGGFQLWANLPKQKKMTDPKYRDVLSSDIPEVDMKGGIKIKVICGEVNGIKGPVQDVFIEPEYLDVCIPADTSFARKEPKGHRVMAYVFEGGGNMAGKKVENTDLVIFEDEGEISAVSGSKGLRFLLIAGKPLKEPVAWYGPIVMNTQEELEKAFEEYQNGTFIKHKK